jgi:hypothetical protein
MKASELRLGNWVSEKDSNGNVHFLKMTIPYLEVLEDEPELFDPIPLTPEILEDCGFLNTTKNNHPLIDSSRFAIYEIDNLICVIQSKFWFAHSKPKNSYLFHFHLKQMEGHEICIIEYLHQLQNLYFALKEKELEIPEFHTLKVQEKSS